MNELVRQSIKNFITELEKRISLLSSTKITENVDHSNYNKLIVLLSKYTTKSPESLETSDLKQIDISSIRLILELIGENKDSIEYIISRLNDDDNLFYDKIREHLLAYIVEYHNINNNQSNMINDKVSLYQKYIELFSKDTFEEPLETNEILKIMTEVGVPDEDKWKILQYIVFKNTHVVNCKDIDLTMRIDSLCQSVSKYIDDKEIYNILKKELEPSTLDITLIPTISENLSQELGLDIIITTNIVVAIVASILLEKFEKIDTPNEEEQMRENILFVLDFVQPIHNEVVYQAREIQRDTEEFFINLKWSGISAEKIDEILETPLSNLESQTGSRESAIELKELPLIKSISETLDSLDKFDIGTKEYSEYCKILGDLLHEYELLEDKKDLQRSQKK